MPLPSPRKDESQEDFQSRCMGDEMARRDFPDDGQRNAVCFRQRDDAHPENPHKESALPDRKCWSNHLGIWAIEPLWFQAAISSYRSGMWPERNEDEIQAAVRERRIYPVEGGTAIIPLQGPMTKAGSLKFDGASTVLTQRMLRQALHDTDVRNILLHVDSPGGHVAGVQALADEVYRVRQSKPVHAHIDDLGASAALWVASQANRITANSTAEVGSIGTVAVLEDTSQRMERLGIKVHVISTGPYKGAGVEGAPLSDETLSYVRERVEGLNRHFLSAVQRGRKLNDAQLGLVSDGRVHMAEAARHLGLIDAVQSLDESIEELQQGGASRIFLGSPQRAALAALRVALGQGLKQE